MDRWRWLLRVEGQKRILEGPFALAFSLTAAGFSLWYLYTSGFGLVSTETNRGLYLMLTSVLVFLLTRGPGRLSLDHLIERRLAR